MEFPPATLSTQDTAIDEMEVETTPTHHSTGDEPMLIGNRMPFSTVQMTTPRMPFTTTTTASDTPIVFLKHTTSHPPTISTGAGTPTIVSSVGPPSPPIGSQEQLTPSDTTYYVPHIGRSIA